MLLPEGYNIRDTERNLVAMEEWLRAQPEVKTVSMTLGSTPPRYYLASSSVSMRPNFGNILVELHDKRQTAAVEKRFNAHVTENFPDVWLRSSLFKLSPVPDAAIEFGFIGDDVDTLRRLTARAEQAMWNTPGAVNVRNGWGNRVPMWQPLYSQMKGQRIGITRSQMARGITIATQGYTLGEYREGDQFMPILLKDENIGSYNLTNLQALPIFNPSGKVFSIEQATDGFRFDFRPGVVRRFNRQRVMKAQCDPGRGVNTMQLFAALRDSVERAVTLPEGYSMKVFGEQESQQESNEALAEYMPLTLVLILIVLLLLFRNYREPVVILLMIPLIFIGVVLGLAVTGKVFNFFSLLGLLGLVGMNIKNAVVLVEQIGVLRAAGKDPLRGPDLGDAQPYRPGGDGLGDDHPGHAAAVVRLDVRRDGRHDHGRAAGRHVADGLRPAGGLRAVLQYPQAMKITVSIIALCLCAPALGQTSLADYRAAVADYSWRLKIAASEAMRRPRRRGAGPHGLPAAARDGRQFHGDRAPFRRRGALDVQPPAAAGADRLRRRCGACGPAGRTGLRHRAVRRGVFAPRRALCRRLRLLEPLGRGTLRRLDAPVRRHHPFAQGDRRPPVSEGYIAKGDVLMIDARLSEAEYSLVNAEQSYEVALHNFNILRGTEPRSAYSSRRASATRCRCPDGSWRPRRWAASRLCRRAAAFGPGRGGDPRSPCAVQSAVERGVGGIVAALLPQPHGRYRRWTARLS